MATKDRNFIEVVITINNEGKEVASKLYRQQYFFVAQTPVFMKNYGLRGESFTISYGAISRHFGKDPDHNLSKEIWEQLPTAITNPFAITEYYREIEHEHLRGYRIYTSIQLGEGYVVVGVDVKVAGRNLLVNSITTVFGKTGRITEFEVEIYRNEKN